MNKILAQDEVDALLRGLSGGDIESETDEGVDEDGVVSFDLANQDRIIRGRMPVLEIVNDRFSRLCTNALSNSLRKRVELNPLSIDMTKFGDFMRSLPVPTSINIFKMDPLRGNAIAVVDARLVFALVESFFGGQGSQPKIEGREFTRIEQAMLWANHRDQFENDFYWSNETLHSESGCAWYQKFSNGRQYGFSRNLELRARAVRRLPI